MSVYIKGFPLPNNCGACPLRLAWCRERIYMVTRPERCPLVPVPPHGRLIDADAFANEVINSFMDCAGLFEDANSLAKAAEIVDAFVADINESPTIIPAEGAESLIGTDMHGGL